MYFLFEFKEFVFCNIYTRLFQFLMMNPKFSLISFLLRSVFICSAVKKEKSRKKNNNNAQTTNEPTTKKGKSNRFYVNRITIIIYCLIVHDLAHLAYFSPFILGCFFSFFLSFQTKVLFLCCSCVFFCFKSFMNKSFFYIHRY